MAKAVKAKKVDGKKLLAELTKGFDVSVPKHEEEYAVRYIEKWYQISVDNHEGALGFEDMTAHEYALESLANGLNDNQHMDNVEVKDLGNGMVLQVEKEQEIVEVDQETLKKALKSLLTKENDRLNGLYEKWKEYNEEFFGGELSYPLITIDKLDNRTLGNYSIGGDAMGIHNHIRFNRNFIALNTQERILETLRHEMIHQWQDEVLYYKEGVKNAKDIKVRTMDENGDIKIVEMRQKKRPKDWHNKDFKEYAKVVGIPARGDKCYGNKAEMPQPQSYNRKFLCTCIASNGYPVSIWSTRFIDATCNICKKPFIEVPKGGTVIPVKKSHIELPGEDAVQHAHRDKYRYFKRFESKELKDEFIEHFNETEEHPMTEMAEGVYQKEHNKYKEGFTHWVAYNTAEVSPDVTTNKEVPKEPKKKPKLKGVEGGKTTPKKKPKKQAPVETPVEPPVEAPKKKAPKIVALPKTDKKDRSHKNAEDLLAVYQETGSVKAVAEYFGVVPGTIIYQAKVLGVDFKKGVVGDEK